MGVEPDEKATPSVHTHVPSLALSLPPGTSAFLATDFLDALLAFGFTPLGKLLKAFTQFPAGEEAVHLSRALGLALDFDSAGLVVEIDAGAGLVDFLSPVSRPPDESLDEIVLQNSEIHHAPFQGRTLVLPDHEAAGAGIGVRSVAWHCTI